MTHFATEDLDAPVPVLDFLFDTFHLLCQLSVLGLGKGVILVKSVDELFNGEIAQISSVYVFTLDCLLALY